MISDTPDFEREPVVASDGIKWAVVWKPHALHPRLAPVLAGNTMSTCRNPTVASGPASALVAWGDGADVRARRIGRDGTLLDTSSGFAISTAFNDQFVPAAAWNGERWFVAWNDYRAHTNILDGGVGDLFGTRVSASGTVLDPARQPIARDFDVPEANPSVAGDLGLSLVAYAAVHAEAPFGTFRITLRGPASAGTFRAVHMPVPAEGLGH